MMRDPLRISAGERMKNLDIISGKEAIELLKHKKECETGKKEVQKWILCSKRLPEQDVLCCDVYGNYIIGIPSQDNEAANTGFVVENDVEYMLDCIAWMPLPEPYNEEGEEC